VFSRSDAIELAYAQAVRQYSSAVMAWPVFLDKQLHIMDNKC